MTTFSECPNCNCDKRGTDVYKCEDCNTIFCRVCKAEEGSIFPHKVCPDCRASKIHKVGSIS